MKWEFQKQMKFPFLFSRDCKGEISQISFDIVNKNRFFYAGWLKKI